MRRPGLLMGAAIGAILAAPLLTILYLAQQLLGLPFAAFDLFDWLTRRLPGGLVTFGIDAMVAVIRRVGVADTSAAAKTAEQGLAAAGLFLALILAGAVLFAVLRRTGWSGIIAGLAIGALAGGAAALLGAGARAAATAAPIAGALWSIVAFLGWGALLGWSHDRLSAPRPGAGSMAVERIDRRTFLIRLGGAAAVITLVGAVLADQIGAGRRRARLAATWSRTHPLPNAGDPVQPVQGTRPELTPLEQHYRIDINTRAPVVREEDWRLRIGGLVGRPAELSLADLRDRYEPTHQFITLACISNPVGGDLIGTTRWTGVALQRVLAGVEPQPNATHLRIRSVDGFHETLPLDAARADPRIMLTYAWDGLPLLPEHGFPLRIYIPDRYGMKQPKWIESIELIDHDEPGYWVQRGWDAVARMKATSVIDTVGMDMMAIQADRGTLVPIGGIAHAGARGISRVQVRVDDGDWRDARLRAPLSGLTWVLWRFEWPFQEGEHTFTVRCFEGDGTPQIATPSPVRPSGATGLDSERGMF